MSDPKPGDRVTDDNAEAIRIGSIAEWTHSGKVYRATKTAPNEWKEDDGTEYNDDTIVDPTEPPAILISIGHGSVTEQVIALLTHAAQTDGAHHKQHDVCEALKVLLSAEDYAALGIVDEGVPS